MVLPTKDVKKITLKDVKCGELLYILNVNKDTLTGIAVYVLPVYNYYFFILPLILINYKIIYYIACPAGFTDNGLYCLKPRAYGRGVGYVLWKRDQCEKDYPKLGCEKNGALWYPKCEPGYHNVGCCICSPNCPEGWTDIGISCKK